MRKIIFAACIVVGAILCMIGVFMKMGEIDYETRVPSPKESKNWSGVLSTSGSFIGGIGIMGLSLS